MTTATTRPDYDEDSWPAIECGPEAYDSWRRMILEMKGYTVRVEFKPDTMRANYDAEIVGFGSRPGLDLEKLSLRRCSIITGEPAGKPFFVNLNHVKALHVY